MPDQLPRPSDSYLLGEMSATMRSIDANVTAMRADIGDLSRRISSNEHDITAIMTASAAALPDYIKLVSDVYNHLRDDTKWKSRFEAGASIAKGGGKAVAAVVSCLITIILFFAGQYLTVGRANNTGNGPLIQVPFQSTQPTQSPQVAPPNHP